MSGDRRLGSDPLAWMDTGRKSASATFFRPTETDNGGRIDTAAMQDSGTVDEEGNGPGAQETVNWAQKHPLASALVHNCPLPCAAFSTQGSALYANPAFVNLLAPEAVEAGCPDWEALFPGATLQAAEGGSLLTRLAAAPEPALAQIKLVAADDDVFMAYVMQLEQIPDDQQTQYVSNAAARQRTSENTAADDHPAQGGAQPCDAPGHKPLLCGLDKTERTKGAKKVLKALKHYRKITEKSELAESGCVDADSLRKFLTYSFSSLARRFKIRPEKLSFSITVHNAALERGTADLLCAAGHSVLHHLLDKYGDRAKATTLYVEVKPTGSDISMIIREDRDRMLRKVKVDGRDKNPLTFVETMLGSAGGGLSLVRLSSTGLLLLIPRAGVTS